MRALFQAVGLVALVGLAIVAIIFLPEIFDLFIKHTHTCDCGNSWEHRGWNFCRTKAHTCPKCGEECWERDEMYYV